MNPEIVSFSQSVDHPYFWGTIGFLVICIICQELLLRRRTKALNEAVSVKIPLAKAMAVEELQEEREKMHLELAERKEQLHLQEKMLLEKRSELSGKEKDLEGAIQSRVKAELEKRVHEAHALLVKRVQNGCVQAKKSCHLCEGFGRLVDEDDLSDSSNCGFCEGNGYVYQWVNIVIKSNDNHEMDNDEMDALFSEDVKPQTGIRFGTA